ncbi:hypothetical protein C4D60_Mb00t17680 [Musa balbisiana]|uniref:Cytochrome b/b6 N-terminal region profile domain-containing protein n=1 Tax=Musa balbisiana TaxID=52838 RepID=A0A4S8I3G3_MUSBA|nr:hypothetical protein C4D60_Mb00t17680 [Musa balbisiana]
MFSSCQHILLFRGITLTCFLVQVATGFAMTFYYRPTVTEAFSSVPYIMTEANFGWLTDQSSMGSAYDGGFKKPRELTWVTGVVLAIAASFGVTGYSLPWDQIGYWAVKIVTGVPEAIPLHTFVLPLLTAVFMLMHFPMIRKQDRLTFLFPHGIHTNGPTSNHHVSPDVAEDRPFVWENLFYDHT